jgi:F-type H+-transporting ATPase subunit delta
MAESSQSPSFDSSRERLGAVYAKGLLGATEAAGVTERVLPELDSLVDDVLNRVPNFEQFLSSPRMRLDEKLRVLDMAFAGRMTPLLLDFLKVVARRGRLDCLREVRAASRKQLNILRGRLEVTVQTATPLSTAQHSQIEQRLVVVLGQAIDLKCSVRPELLGGLLVRIGDTVFDGSLDNRLETMRVQLTNRTAQVIRDSLERFLITD